MPIYEYICEDCGQAFELLRRMAERDRPAPCPGCAGSSASRQLSAFATHVRNPPPPPPPCGAPSAASCGGCDGSPCMS